MEKTIAEMTIEELVAYVKENNTEAKRLRDEAAKIETGLKEAKAAIISGLNLKEAKDEAGELFEDDSLLDDGETKPAKKEGKRERAPNKVITEAMKKELPALLTGLLKEGLTKLPQMVERLEAYNRKTVDEALQAMVKDKKVKREGELAKTVYTLR